MELNDRKYNYPIDYFMLNILFKYAYDHSELFHSIIEDIPVNNENLYEHIAYEKNGDNILIDSKINDNISNIDIWKVENEYIRFF